MSDPTERLLQQRIVVLGTPIDDEVATRVIAQLLFLDDQDSRASISLYINSEGGSATAAFAIYDVLQATRAPLNTICLGHAGGVTALLLAAAGRGHRFATSQATVTLAPLEGGIHGRVTPQHLHDQERLRRQYAQALALHTGQPVTQIEVDLRARRSFLAAEAVTYGLVDAVVPSRAR